MNPYVQDMLTAYRARRYLRKAHKNLLIHRLDSLKNNYWTTECNGHVIIDYPKKFFWLAKIVETLSEMQMRGMLNQISVDDLDREIVDAVARSNSFPDVLGGRNLPTAPYLVRYSKAEFIEGALEDGTFLVRPASSYNDPSLNSAQRDEELLHATVTADRQLNFRINGFMPGETPDQARPMPVEPLELYEYMAVTEFFVLCMSDTYNPRMFNDFKADAAIIITEPDEFLKRVERSMSSLHPDYIFSHGRVSYYDPYTIDRPDLLPGFSKNFAYSYQREHRLIWRPQTTLTNNDQFLIKIGSLRDIAYTVSLA